MPRDGSGIYTQPEPDVVTDTPIESAVYNNFVADVSTDLNAPRPVIAGGTGADNALDAMQTLGGEIAEQEVVNYDSFPFQSGSFYSAGSATGGPVGGHAFVGIAYKSDDANVVLEARDQNDTEVPGTRYVREKKAGVWSAWVDEGSAVGEDIDTLETAVEALEVDVTALETDVAAVEAAVVALDAAKVNRAGDTISGPLIAANKGHLFGIHGGTPMPGGALPADASVMLYKASDVNWAGFGVDNNGNLWCRVGLSGAPWAAWWINSGSLVTDFVASPTAPTPPPLDDTTKLATTQFNNHAARLINFQSTSYTFVLTDAGTLVVLWVGTPCTFTVPPNSSVAFPAGTQIDLAAMDVGQLTIAAGAGVNLASEDGKRKLAKPFSAATLIKMGTDTWLLTGSLVA